MGYYKNRITERYDAASEPMPVYWFRFQELTEKKMRMQTDRLRGGRRVRSEELACTDPRYVFHPKDVTTALELEKQHLLVNGYSEEDLAWIEQLVADYLNAEKQSDVLDRYLFKLNPKICIINGRYAECHGGMNYDGSGKQGRN